MGNTAGKKEGVGDDYAPSPKDDFQFDFTQPSAGGRRGRYQQGGFDEPMDEYAPSRTLGSAFSDLQPIQRPRARTISTGTTISAHALPTVFRWDGGGKKVLIAGSFNGWKTKIQMVKSTENFMTIIELAEGEHQYKFCVDGDWKHDPKQPVVNNNLGSVNNVVSVKKTDFEVFEALAVDSSKDGHGLAAGVVSGSPPGEYSQEIPVKTAHERSSGPPILPPHLLQVILNKDTPVSCEPSLLPEPHHVMLNHLYALSIKVDKRGTSYYGKTPHTSHYTANVENSIPQVPRGW
ncbi:PREDICTED: 5'-AMP-activated protein kinase subunit beta-1-like [Priapulus caudatus]|uniref:5'-AMP-activated protein kinase subunit beta-1 n=1 Tax=Priapulus caudatus TaxID=37621 RepID=A0ABM1EI01_PRICU|nr:PREDICTED: 5'-AMP-activated protein kinase subunit beta-1-like [Priapulus caudatus]